MPIKPENRKLYPPNWRALSKQVREEAGQKCERCKAPNGASVARADGSYMLDDGSVFDDDTGASLGKARGSEYPAIRHTRIVLTVAHLDQNPANNLRTNLAAYCQRCHLRHDQAQHVASARETRRKRKAVGELPGVGR